MIDFCKSAMLVAVLIGLVPTSSAGAWRVRGAVLNQTNDCRPSRERYA